MADGNGASRNSENIRPAIDWAGAPEGTRSYAVIVVDKDVPASFENANRSDKTLPADMPRKNFYHWILVDIPSSLNGLPESTTGITEQGISGINNFGSQGKNQGSGYDGPCPPWNDERLHHYNFIVYALDVASLNLSGRFTGQDAEKAIEQHLLATGEIVGTYTTNQKKINN